MNNLFKNIYKNKNVLITGHTGFKGSWLALWMKELGANVTGYALLPPTQPNHFELLNLDINSIIADIRKKEKLLNAIKISKPDIVFHLAAQPLVRLSYQNPIDTFETNIIGTANLFESCRAVDSVKAIVNVTTDKCYENREWLWGYRENDRLGGYDPYSASKACSELITASYRNSFFNINDYGKKHNVLVASARAGNVIGGGDWAEDRLIPDIIRSIARKEKVIIRSPGSTRPWQHVLESLSGYLLLGQKLLESDYEFAEAWNFGPSIVENISVREIVECLRKHWNIFEAEYLNISDCEKHETNYLKLDCTKALLKLEWQTVWDLNSALSNTIDWYKKYYDKREAISKNQLEKYIKDARKKKLCWVQ